MIQILDRQYKIGIAFMTYGRLAVMDRTIPNLYEMVINHYQFDQLIMVDDSGQQDSWDYMSDKLPEFYHIIHGSNRGLAFAVNSAWSFFNEEIDYIFYVEDDFLFWEIPQLTKMLLVMEADKSLSQIILKRNPVNPEEISAGGYIEMNPNSFANYSYAGIPYIKHDRFFSLNPGLIPRRVFHDMGWPETNEAGMIRHLTELGYRSAIWGKTTDSPIIQHIGHRTSWWKE